MIIAAWTCRALPRVISYFKITQNTFNILEHNSLAVNVGVYM